MPEWEDVAFWFICDQEDNEKPKPLEWWMMEFPTYAADLFEFAFIYWLVESRLMGMPEEEFNAEPSETVKRIHARFVKQMRQEMGLSD